MNLTIFGASGKTGRHLLAQALAGGHTVTALVRSPARLRGRDARLKVIEGDVRDLAQVTAAVAGAEAVISVLGPSSNRPELAVSAGIDNLVTAMRQHEVRRLIQTAGAGVRDPRDRPTPVHAFFGLLVRVLTPNVLADMQQAVEKVRSSGLDWTVVRVPRLTDGPATGRLRAGYVGQDIGPSLARADLAAFLLQQLTDRSWVGQAPAVSN